MASIGDILDEFFSPFSSEKLWVMPENDDYTNRVRAWDPVIQAVARIKNNVATFCDVWATTYMSDAAWTPGKTDSPKPGAYRDFSPSPKGTDPETCKSAFIVYVATKAARMLPGRRGSKHFPYFAAQSLQLRIEDSPDVGICLEKLVAVRGEARPPAALHVHKRRAQRARAGAQQAPGVAVGKARRMRRFA